MRISSLFLGKKTDRDQKLDEDTEEIAEIDQSILYTLVTTLDNECVPIIGTKVIHHKCVVCFESFNAANCTVSIDGEKPEPYRSNNYLFPRKGRHSVELRFRKILRSLYGLFYNCANITEINKWDVCTTQCYNICEMCFGCTNLRKIDELKWLETDKVFDASGCFAGCKNLENISALTHWNMYKCINFSAMFDGCICLKQIYPLRWWNLRSAENLSCMFRFCTSLNSIQSISSWSVENVEDVSYLFYYCVSLQDVNPLNNWKLLSVTDTSHMFEGCLSIVSKPVLCMRDFVKYKNDMYRSCLNLPNQ